MRGRVRVKNEPKGAALPGTPIVNVKSQPAEFKDSAVVLRGAKCQEIGQRDPRALYVEQKGQDSSSLSFPRVRVHRRDSTGKKAAGATVHCGTAWVHCCTPL
jgi:hypothetical protein